jgi:hypothetical protein
MKQTMKMNATHESHAVHTFLSREVTKGMLLAYLERWQHEFPGWKWRYARDKLQPGDWALDLMAPTGQTYAFFLHPVGDVLRLLSPAPLAAPG